MSPLFLLNKANGYIPLKKQISNLLVLSLLVVGAAGLSACASNKKEPVIGKVDDLYNAGMNQLQAREFEASIHTFEELERQHPYSGWATRAQMMIVYAQYRIEKYEDALFNIDRFIRLHPGYEDLAYMYYMRGMIFYTQISDVNRDQGFTEEAYKSFREVIQRFPDSRYARDASLKITLTLDHMAGKEMTVGRFYLEQGKYLAALNRFKKVVDAYQQTLQVPEALYRLTEVYYALGLDDQAQRSAAVLGHNYPETDWYKMAYKLMTSKGHKPAKVVK